MIEDFARRAHYADRLETLFRARPLVWIGLPELLMVGGPSWRSRIADELRSQRGMTITWNKCARASAYMFTPYVPIAPSHEPSGQRRLELNT